MATRRIARLIQVHPVTQGDLRVKGGGERNGGEVGGGEGPLRSLSFSQNGYGPFGPYKVSNNKIKNMLRIVRMIMFMMVFTAVFMIFDFYYF